MKFFYYLLLAVWCALALVSRGSVIGERSLPDSKVEALQESVDRESRFVVVRPVRPVVVVRPVRPVFFRPGRK